MYEDIGKKIKSLATIVCWLGIITSVIIAIFLFASIEKVSYHLEGTYTILGLCFMFLGPIVSWISGSLIYGFGELIDKACDIERNTRPHTENDTFQSSPDTDRAQTLQNLRSKGLISEDEYQEAIAKNN